MMCRPKHRKNTTTKVHSVEEEPSVLYIHSHSTKEDVEPWTEKIQIGQVEFEVKLDSGAQCNVVSKTLAQKLNIDIKPSITKKLITYSDDTLKVIGEINTVCKVKKTNVLKKLKTCYHNRQC